MNLALKYRPRTFDDVVGQKAISVILQAMIEKNVLDQVLLFTGPSGVGKTSMARIIAAQLNSEAAQDVHEGTHPAVLEIDAASNGSVAALRQLKKDLNYAIVGHRVVILDEAHAISDEGKAVLLNLLENPPTNVTFILITTESHQIPKQVRHRCDTYKFKKASVEDLTKRITYVAEQENILIDDELINLIAQRSEGSYRESLMILNQIWIGSIQTVEQYNAMHGEFDYGPQLIKHAMQGYASAQKYLQQILTMYPVEDITDRLIECLRDLMLLKGNFDIDHTGNSLEFRQELANRVDSSSLLKATRIMWDLQTKLTNADQTRGLEMAFSLISDAICTTPDTIFAKGGQVNSTSTPMSLQQLRQRS